MTGNWQGWKGCHYSERLLGDSGSEAKIVSAPWSAVLMKWKTSKRPMRLNSVQVNTVPWAT
jgi:hypothetical protein